MYYTRIWATPPPSYAACILNQWPLTENRTDDALPGNAPTPKCCGQTARCWRRHLLDFCHFLSYCKVFISHFERQFRLGKTLLICQQKSVMFIYRIGSKTLGRLSTPGIGPGPPTCSPWILCTAEGSVFPKRRDGRIVKTCFVHVIPLSGTCFDMTLKRATRQSQTLNNKSIAMDKTGSAI